MGCGQYSKDSIEAKMMNLKIARIGIRVEKEEAMKKYNKITGENIERKEIPDYLATEEIEKGMEKNEQKRQMKKKEDVDVEEGSVNNSQSRSRSSLSSSEKSVTLQKKNEKRTAPNSGTMSYKGHNKDCPVLTLNKAKTHKPSYLKKKSTIFKRDSSREKRNKAKYEDSYDSREGDRSYSSYGDGDYSRSYRNNRRNKHHYDDSRDDDYNGDSSYDNVYSDDYYKNNLSKNRRTNYSLSYDDEDSGRNDYSYQNNRHRNRDDDYDSQNDYSQSLHSDELPVKSKKSKSILIRKQSRYHH